MKINSLAFRFLTLPLVLVACDGGGLPQTFGPPTPAEGGPKVKFDLFARPLPEVPLPNDIAARPDPDSPTGLRLNASILAADTEMEQRTRAKIDGMDGWGVYGPISVGFDAPLDLDNILARHVGDDFDTTNDAVYVVNVDPRDRGTPEYGRPSPVDIGEGNFPVVLQEPNRYYENDPRGTTSNILFETVNEDVNGNGVMDPGEDTDFDGVLDHANFLDPDGTDDVADLVSFYERETNTLILRPLIPLKERTRYAVVLTKRLLGEDGRPVRSPFPYFHHVDQAADLAGLEGILSDRESYGDLDGLNDVAFAWTFTTSSVREDILTMREGMEEGTGPFARLFEEFPPEAFWAPLHECNPYGGPCDLPANLYVVTSDFLAPVLRRVAVEVFELNEEEARPLLASYQYVAYFVFGWVTSPQFLDSDGDGWEEESWEVNSKTGRGRHTPGRVNFLAAVPKPEFVRQYNERNGRPAGTPAPVVFYGHGYTGFKVESLGFGGNLAKFGLTTVGWDCVHHGAGLDTTLRDVALGIFDVNDIHGAGLALLDDRAIDLDNEKFSGPGSDPADLEPAPCDRRPCFPTMHFDVPASGFRDWVARLPGGANTDRPNAWLGTYDPEVFHWSNVMYQDDDEDSAGDFWTSYVFHTRDVVRQSALDLIRILQVFRSFDGTRPAQFDVDGDGERERYDFNADGRYDFAGDFDGDGDVDFGGPDNDYYVWGQSLGGIMSGVLGGTHPSIRAVAPVAGGGGLADVGIRSTQGGVKEAVILRMMGPLVVSVPASTRFNADPRRNRTACCSGDTCDPSAISLRFIVPQQNNTGEVEIACLNTGAADARTLLPGDVVVLRNMRHPTEPRCAVVAAESRVRLSIPADFKDPLEITVYDGASVSGYPLLDAGTCRLAEGIVPRTAEVVDGATRLAPIAAFEVDPPPFEWDDYGEGDELVAVAEGLGLRRGTPELRRFMGIAQMVLDPGDPAVYAPFYRNSMVIATIGDMNVPVNTGISIARTAGILGFGADAVDPRWGKTPNRVLLDEGVIMGLERLSPPEWVDSRGRPALLDPDDLSLGTDGFDAPSLTTLHGQPPLRAWRPSRGPASACHVRSRADGMLERVECPEGVSLLVMPYMSAQGDHGFATPSPLKPFDVDTFMINMIGTYFGHQGRVVEYDHCLADSSCSFIPPYPYGPDWP